MIKNIKDCTNQYTPLSFNKVKEIINKQINDSNTKETGLGA